MSRIQDLEKIKDLVISDPVPNEILKPLDMAWAIYRHGQVPENYIVCTGSFWGQVCKALGYIPAHVRCRKQSETYISFCPEEIDANHKKQGVKNA